MARTIATMRESCGSGPSIDRLAGLFRFAVSIGIATVVGLEPVAAQTVPRSPGPFKDGRYDEDPSGLADPATSAGPFDAVKHVPLGADPDVYVSFGGELRQRFEHLGDEAFGLPLPRNDDDLRQRSLFHADLHLGPNVRVFAQVGDHRAFDRSDPLRPTDANDGDLQQGFVDLAAPLGGGGQATLRVGRQEVLLGSGHAASAVGGGAKTLSQ